MRTFLKIILISILTIAACFILLLIVFWISWYFPPSGPSPRDYYSGFVVDEAGNPLQGVSVREECNGNRATTDSTGYFRFDATIRGYLIFTKERYKTDSVPMMWTQGGERYHTFLLQDSTQLILQADPGNTF